MNILVNLASLKKNIIKYQFEPYGKLGENKGNFMFKIHPSNKIYKIFFYKEHK